jgi:hypothetical protein
MSNTQIACVLSVLDNLSVELKILKDNADKENHAICSKIGQKGWILYRKYHVVDYDGMGLTCNQKTSVIAKHWRTLSKEEKAKWHYSATHSTECGNRWTMYV